MLSVFDLHSADPNKSFSFLEGSPLSVQRRNLALTMSSECATRRSDPDAFISYWDLISMIAATRSLSIGFALNSCSIAKPLVSRYKSEIRAKAENPIDSSTAIGYSGENRKLRRGRSQV